MTGLRVNNRVGLLYTTGFLLFLFRWLFSCGFFSEFFFFFRLCFIAFCRAENRTNLALPLLNLSVGCICLLHWLLYNSLVKSIIRCWSMMILLHYIMIVSFEIIEYNDQVITILNISTMIMILNMIINLNWLSSFIWWIHKWINRILLLLKFDQCFLARCRTVGLIPDVFHDSDPKLVKLFFFFLCDFFFLLFSEIFWWRHTFYQRKNRKQCTELSSIGCQVCWARISSMNQ